MPVRCLVTGATGYVGGRLIPRLLQSGYSVRAMARDGSQLADEPWARDVDIVTADLSDADSLARAFADIHVAYYLVHSMGTASDFSAEEAASVANTVTAARNAGVRRLVYLGGLHPTGEELSTHLQSRTAVGDALLQSGSRRSPSRPASSLEPGRRRSR